MYKIGNTGPMPVGWVETSCLKYGMVVTLSPPKLKSVMMPHEACQRPCLMTTWTPTQSMCPRDSRNDCSVGGCPQVMVLNHPGQSHAGYKAVLGYHMLTSPERKENTGQHSAKRMEDNPKP